MEAPSFFRVRNFERFQHYKDRNPRWIKLYAELLGNYEFSLLTDEQRYHLIGIWLIASQRNNRIPCDGDWLGVELHASGTVDIAPLLDLGFLEMSDGDAPPARASWPPRYIPAKVRAAVLKRDGERCQQCGSTENIELDHRIPVSRGGESVASNLQVLCRSCNRRKRSKISKETSSEQVATQENDHCVASRYAQAPLLRSLEREAEADIDPADRRISDQNLEILLDDANPCACDAALPPSRNSTTTINDAEPDEGSQSMRAPATEALRGFDQFWENYPRREAKKRAREIWRSKRLADHSEMINADVIKRAAEHRGWREGFVPHASTYLNGERWTDDIDPTPPGPGARNGAAQSGSKGNARLSAVERVRAANPRAHRGL